MLNDYPDILTVKQVAEILGVGHKAIYNLIHEKKLGCLIIGKNYKIPKDCLRLYMASAKYTVIS